MEQSKYKVSFKTSVGRVVPFLSLRYLRSIAGHGENLLSL